MPQPNHGISLQAGAGWIKSALKDVSGANPKQIEDLKEIFLLFDDDEDGQLSNAQVRLQVLLLMTDHGYGRLLLVWYSVELWQFYSCIVIWWHAPPV